MSPTTHKEQAETDDRRLYSRGTIRRVVLVFFGLGKWGKLINICEGGMAFESYEPPPRGQRIGFALEIACDLPKPSDKASADSIHADGHVVWTRDFEKCAGVQFVDISEGTGQQIRRWLSIEAFSGAAAESERVRRDGAETELPGRSLTLDETTSQGTDDAQLSNAGLAQSSSPKVLWGRRSDEQSTPEELTGAKSRIDRAALMSVARWVAVLAMLGGVITMVLSQRVHLAAVFESIRARSIGNNAPTRARERSVAKTPLIFQVEAVDANNRKRLLTFDNDASAVDRWLSSGTVASSTPDKPILVNAAAPPSGTTPPEKRRSLSNLKLGSPRVTRLATNASAEDSTLAIDSVAPSRDAIRGNLSGDILANTAAQPPAAPEPIPVGGQVQQARLISSVSPAYPALARAIALQGDVTIDALIDATGKVVTMKRLSGPVALQQAAMDALRQWKYEPARLDGRPVSTHLSVTMQFRLD